MHKKWRNKLNKGKFLGVMFMDFKKKFVSIIHNAFFAKLEAYGFSGISLQLMRSYLKNRKRRFIVNSTFSE